MKKIEKLLVLLLVLMGIIMLPSCSDDKEKNEPSITIPSTVSINVGSTMNLGMTGNWSSSNDFIASVSGQGIITGNHVGTCKVTNGNKTCSVTIKPTVSLYKDPITEWGMSKAEVIAQWGDDYMEIDNAIGYNTGNPIAPILMYSFKNGKLASSVMTVSTQYTDTLVDFLLERYKSIGVSDYDFFFINNNSIQSATTIIGVTLFNKEYWEIIYMPNDITKSGELEDEKISSKLKTLMSKID